MGDLEGVGRVYRPELNPKVERHPQIEKADRDKHGKDHDEPKEEPHDTVELHEEAEDSQQDHQDGDQPKRPSWPRKLDISA